MAQRIRKIRSAAVVTKQEGGKPRPVGVDEKIADLVTRVAVLEKRIEHDLGGSDSAHLGARVDALEEASEACGRRLDEVEQRLLGTRSIPRDALARLAKVEAEVSLLGISDRLNQHATRIAAIEADREEAENSAGTGARS